MTGQVAYPLVLLAGVPGAGKTEALKTIRRQAPSIRISDPETVRSTLHHWAPWLPYSLCLPFVHITAHLGVLFKILHRGGGPLIVHDPGTRRWSRRLILRLALHRHCQVSAVYIDIDRGTALKGQVQRGRIVRHSAFERHWRHWIDLRSRISAGAELTPGERWPRIVLSSRDSVVDDLFDLLNLNERQVP